MRAQHTVVGHEERVVHVARRMIARNVERLEVVIVVLDLGSLVDREAQLDEDVDDLVEHLRERMEVPAREAHAGQA